MSSIKDNSNFPLIVTILLTVVLMVGGIMVLSKTSEPPLPPEEIEATLVKEDSNFTGEENAEIVIVEFSDFECPACASYYQEIIKVKESYPDRVKIVYRHFPLRNKHPLAQLAAEASEAAAAQNLFWQMHNKLFEGQVEWSSLNETKAKEKFAEYAQDLEIEDIDKFKQELDNGTYTQKVSDDLSDAGKLKLGGTPSIFFNGEQRSNPTFEELQEEIEALLPEQSTE